MNLGLTSPPCLMVLFQITSLPASTNTNTSNDRNVESNYRNGSNADDDMFVSARLFMGFINLPAYRNPEGTIHLNKKIADISPLYEGCSSEGAFQTIMRITPAPSIGSTICQYVGGGKMRSISPFLMNNYISNISFERNERIEHMKAYTDDNFFSTLHHAVASLSLGVDHLGYPLNESNWEDNDCVH